MENSNNSSTNNNNIITDKIENKNLNNKSSKINLENLNFNEYYRLQLFDNYFKTEENFNEFILKLKEKIICAFRINKSHLFFHIFQKILNSPDKLNSILNLTELKTSIQITKIKLINIPQFLNIFYYINLNKNELKSNNNLTNFHKFIQNLTNTGLINRQEIVSMLPPMLLETKLGDKILDMCAAPGNKTSQFLESFYSNYNYFDKEYYKKDTGFIIANDNNNKRAYMMISLLKKINTAGMFVVWQEAQNFPNIFSGNNIESKIFYDKILCDVPCSSDAIMRKLQIKWKNWNLFDGYVLHKTQLKILKKGINLLNLNGLLVYSTCSLNPIENEAIITEIKRIYKDEIEILDVKKYFENCDIKINEGLLNWKVLFQDENKKIIEFKTYDEINNEKYKNYIEKSCFPSNIEQMKEMKINNSIRLIPNNNINKNIDGFFITLIKRVKNRKIEGDEFKNTHFKKKTFTNYFFVKDNFPEIYKWLFDYYGIDDEFPGEQLITFSKNCHKINFISKGIYNILKGEFNRIRVQNCGVKLFSKIKGGNEEVKKNCKLRINQNGIMYLLPFMHKKVYFIKEDLFKILLEKVELKIEEIKEENIKIMFEKCEEGYIILVISKVLPDNNNNDNIEFLKNNFIDVVSCYRSKKKLCIMLKKEQLYIYKIKYNIKF